MIMNISAFFTPVNEKETSSSQREMGGHFQ